LSHLAARRRAFWAGVALSASALAALAGTDPRPAPPAVTAHLDNPADDGSAVLRRLQAAIGQARCQRDDQCRTVAIGTMACGGPEGYLAWSVVDGRTAEVQTLAAQHAQLRQAWHQHTGIASVCAVRTNPGAYCQAAAVTEAPSRAPAARRCALKAPAGTRDPR